MFALSSKMSIRASRSSAATSIFSAPNQFALAKFGAGPLRPAKEGGRIRVVDQMIWINIVPPDGVPRRVSAYKDESLLEVIKRGEIPGIFNDCDGGDKEYNMVAHQVPYDFYSAGVNCGQCSVHIPDPWFDKLNDQQANEKDRLMKRAMGNSEFSRLACCVRITPELNEMICVVGNNRSGSGDWFSGSDPNAF